jgi:hypothetical protein
MGIAASPGRSSDSHFFDDAVLSLLRIIAGAALPEPPAAAERI